MAYHGVVDDVRSVACGHKPKRLPVFACSEEFDVKWHGKYSYEEVCQDGEKMAEVWIAADRGVRLRLGLAPGRRLLRVRAAGRGHARRGQHPPRDPRLPARQPGKRSTACACPTRARDGRMPEKLKAIAPDPRALRRLRAGGGKLRGAVQFRRACSSAWKRPMLAGHDRSGAAGRGTCDFFVELQARYIEAQVEAGAHAIWLGDCNAFSAMLSLDQYRRFALPVVPAAGGEGPRRAARWSTCTTARSPSPTCWPRRSWAWTSSTAARRPTWPRCSQALAGKNCVQRQPRPDRSAHARHAAAGRRGGRRGS